MGALGILGAFGADAKESHAGLGVSCVEGGGGNCNAFGFPAGRPSSYTFERNIVHLTATPYFSSGEFAPPNGDYFSPADWRSDSNVFFGAAPGAPMPLHYPNGTQGLPAWRAAWGCDDNSVVYQINAPWRHLAFVVQNVNWYRTMGIFSDEGMNMRRTKS